MLKKEKNLTMFFKKKLSVKEKDPQKNKSEKERRKKNFWRERLIPQRESWSLLCVQPIKSKKWKLS